MTRRYARVVKVPLTSKMYKDIKKALKQANSSGFIKEEYASNVDEYVIREITAALWRDFKIDPARYI